MSRMILHGSWQDDENKCGLEQVCRDAYGANGLVAMRGDDRDGDYGAGTWLRLPAGASRRMRCHHAALVWPKHGHLADWEPGGLSHSGYYRRARCPPASGL